MSVHTVLNFKYIRQVLEQVRLLSQMRLVNLVMIRQVAVLSHVTLASSRLSCVFLSWPAGKMT